MCKECCFAGYAVGVKASALEAGSFTNNLSKGHMIHMAMLMSKHLHNKKQSWMVANCKQLLMEMQIQNSFLKVVHQPILNIKLKILIFFPWLFMFEKLETNLANSNMDILGVLVILWGCK